MPTLTGHTWAGAEVSTASTRGRVLVLNVWASWCEPCQAESPALARVAGQQDPLAVRFIGLDEHDTEAAATAFVRSVGSTYPHLVDDGGLLGRLSPWLPDAVPDSLVVDGQGLVAARVVGAVTEEQLRTVLNQVRTP
ncbi:MAG: TlpA disulfide reductase family protein [Nostocoides sp.]